MKKNTILSAAMIGSLSLLCCAMDTRQQQYRGTQLFAQHYMANNKPVPQGTLNNLSHYDRLRALEFNHKLVQHPLYQQQQQQK